MRLRSSLFLLSFATAAPLIAFALLAAEIVVRGENQNLVTAAKARNRATMSAIDAELRGVVGTLEALAVGRTLRSGDFQAFHGQANEVLKTQPGWLNVLVHDAKGRQLIDANVPWGTALPEHPVAPASIQAVVRHSMPVIDDLQPLPAEPHRLGVPVRAPVVEGGTVRYVLTAVVSPDAIQRLLVTQNLPEGWVSGVVDRNGRLVARVPPRPPGSKATDAYLAQVAAASEGWYRGRTLEDADSWTAFVKSDLTDWSVGYAIPAELVAAGAVRARALMGAGIALSIGAAALIGFWLSRAISRPMSKLVDGAAQLGTSEPPAEVRSSIDEVAWLSRALADASRAITLRDAELRRSAAELEQQAAELRRSDVNKRRFLALLSHELRNPLAPLRNGLTLLGLRGDTKGVVDIQQMMERQVVHLTRLIDDLLDVSRIDRGSLELRRERVAVDSFVQSAIETVKPALEGKRQQLVVRYSPVPLYVDGDPVRLSQIMSNLVGNASKFTAPDGRIEVAIGYADGEATISVFDEGVGFAPEDGRRMFEMFVQLDAGRNHPGGLGLGLTIVRSLVEMHGGRIEAHSDGPGTGATFTVHLPVVAAPGEAAQPPRAPRPRAANRRVLVVDDNADAAVSLAMILRRAGFDVREAYDGAHALEIARGFEPEVAFIDMDMPGMSGIELAAALRTLRPHAPPRLVAVTGMAQQSDIDASRAAGFSAHLTKPAPADAILELAAAPPDNVVPLRGDRQKLG